MTTENVHHTCDFTDNIAINEIFFTPVTQLFVYFTNCSLFLFVDTFTADSYDNTSSQIELGKPTICQNENSIICGVVGRPIRIVEKLESIKI